MSLRIYNTLTRAVAEFIPHEAGHVRMDVCGITVYDLCHVGHARSAVAFDVVQRWLKTRGLRVTFVRNITDIDDKIIRRALENGESIRGLTDRMVAREASLTQEFVNSLLLVETPLVRGSRWSAWWQIRPDSSAGLLAEQRDSAGGVTQRIMVDLPEPDGPQMTSFSPRFTASICRAISYSAARRTPEKLFMFLISIFAPSSFEPTGRTLMFTSQRTMPFSMSQSDTPPCWRISFNAFKYS